jgi:hypothetical protein
VTARQALALLEAAGAAEIEHPGGTLLAHLVRVEGLLTSWGARPALATAGLCHAYYGTDGFSLALLTLDRRAELAEVIGEEAEALVYLYASCDRKASYRTLAGDDDAVEFVDRFTGSRIRASLDARRDFAELTAANELDIAAVSPAMRERWQELLSEAARRHCRTVLICPPC